MKEIYYLCREKTKIGRLGMTGRFVTVPGLHYLCGVFIKTS